MGQIVSAQGLAPSPTKLTALNDLLSPTNFTEVSSFISLASYNIRFIKNFAQISHPLHQLMQKVVEFKWTTECQEAFTNLYHRPCHATVMAFLDYNLPFLLYMDMQLFTIGAVTALVRENHEHIVACASHSLTAPEKNYSAIKREFLYIG